MRTKLMTVAFAAAAAMTLNAQAPQSPATPAPQSPAAQAPTAPAPRPSIAQEAQKAAAAQTITITGCLKEQKDVPGLKASDDIVVTDVKMSPSSSVSGIGVAARYQVAGVAEAELKKHIGHQVELTGTAAQAAPGAPADEAPDFKATALKMVAATCGAK